MAKLTWDDVYRDFRKRHPRLAKDVLGFEPYGFATILLMFPNRVRMTYNYDTKKATTINLNHNRRDAKED